jgi:hypothetical protein
MNLNLGSNRCCNLPFKKDIIGSQGPQGYFGPIGIIGSTGYTGVTGSQGSTGLCYKGYKGPQGSQGYPGGITGPQGPIGPSGNIITTSNSINCNFTFTINGLASYDLNYVDLTSFATSSITNILTPLRANNYSIYWTIFESWTDPNTNFAVRFNNGGELIYPTVFSADYPLSSGFLNTPSILYTNGTYNYGSGNDFIFLNNTPYSIELIQWTTSGNTISIPSKTINFSITIVPMS